MSAPEPPLDHPREGTILSHYRLLSCLGEGGFGEVHAAEDLRLPRRVALKLLSRVHAADVAARRRFLDEATAVSALDHPHICLLYEFDESQGTPFIAMQLVEGENLKQAVARGPLGEARTREVIAAVASALGAAHARGILHRDVKSANILLGRDGSIKLADFGLARLAEVSGLTTTGTVVGTPHTMAPEVLQGEPATEASDQFSLAAVAYECLTGVPPFAAERLPALVYAITQTEPTPPSRRRPGISRAWDALIARGLAKQAAQRFRSMADFARAVAECGTGSGAVAAPPESAPAPAVRSVAVLFFENLSSDPESDYFCAGITEDILTDLSKVAGLRVASRDAVARFRNQGSDALRVAAELGVDAVVEGRVRRAGNRVRITTQLVDAGSGFHLWAERYDRTLDDVFAVQEDIAHSIAGALGRTLSPALTAEMRRAKPADIEAYDLYLRGRDYYRRYTEDDNRRALECFERAVQVDPNYALAWAGIADCCAQMLDKGWDPDASWQERGFEAARRSIELDSRLAEGHKAEALLWSTRRDPSRAIRALERALDADPRFIPALINLAQEYLTGGDLAGAERTLRRAVEVDPASGFSHLLLGTVLLYTRRYRAALDPCHRAQKEGASSFYDSYAHAIRAHALAEEADFEAAAAELAAAHAAGVPGRILAACEALVLARSGNAPRASELLAELERQAPEQSYGCELAAFAAGVLGNAGAAVGFLRAAEAIDQRHGAAWRLSPELRRVRESPEFRDLIGDRGRRLVWPLEAPLLSAEDRSQFTVYSEASGLPN